jgi:hypothetical protein
MKNKLVLIALCSMLIISCDKDETTTPTPAVKTSEEMLVAKTWKADEVRVQQSNNVSSYYKRGVTGTAYDSDSIKFSANNTGTYYFSGMSYSTTWNFTDAAKTKMTLVINQSPAISVYLENIHITETSIKYAQYFTGTVSYLASATRVPN